MAPLFVAGRPGGTAAWSGPLGEAAADLVVDDGLRLDFTIAPTHWVDLDTLAESTLHGLRRAGLLAPRFVGLDSILATKQAGAPTGALLTPAPADALAAVPVPGHVELDVASDVVPRPGNREAKTRWRERLRGAWVPRPALDGAVWAEVRLATPGSLLGPVEVVLDALEPVLGRDPRGRDWQQFFPNDHCIDWLRVLRLRSGPALSLRLGRIL